MSGAGRVDRVAGPRIGGGGDPVTALVGAYLASADEEADVWRRAAVQREQVVAAARAKGYGESAIRKAVSQLEGRHAFDLKEPRIRSAFDMLVGAAGSETVGEWLETARSYADAAARTWMAASDLQEAGGRGLRIAAEGASELGGLKSELLAIATRINPTLDMRFVRDLKGEGPGLIASGAGTADRMSVAGMYEPYHHLATISLDRARFNPKDTAYHEGFHSIEGVLTPPERATLIKAFPPAAGMTTSERAAIAFAEWALKREGADRERVLKESGAEDVRGLRTVFRKMGLFTGRAGQAMLGRGFGSAEAIFEKVFQGELGNRDQARRPHRRTGARRRRLQGPAARRSVASIGQPMFRAVAPDNEPARNAIPSVLLDRLARGAEPAGAAFFTHPEHPGRVFRVHPGLSQDHSGKLMPVLQVETVTVSPDGRPSTRFLHELYGHSEFARAQALATHLRREYVDACHPGKSPPQAAADALRDARLQRLDDLGGDADHINGLAVRQVMGNGWQAAFSPERLRALIAEEHAEHAAAAVSIGSKRQTEADSWLEAARAVSPTPDVLLSAAKLQQVVGEVLGAQPAKDGWLSLPVRAGTKGPVLFRIRDARAGPGEAGALDFRFAASGSRRTAIHLSGLVNVDVDLGHADTPEAGAGALAQLLACVAADAQFFGDVRPRPVAEMAAQPGAVERAKALQAMDWPSEMAEAGERAAGLRTTLDHERLHFAQTVRGIAGRFQSPGRGWDDVAWDLSFHPELRIEPTETSWRLVDVGFQVPKGGYRPAVVLDDVPDYVWLRSQSPVLRADVEARMGPMPADINEQAAARRQERERQAAERAARNPVKRKWGRGQRRFSAGVAAREDRGAVRVPSFSEVLGAARPGTDRAALQGLAWRVAARLAEEAVKREIVAGRWPIDGDVYELRRRPLLVDLPHGIQVAQRVKDATGLTVHTDHMSVVPLDDPAFRKEGKPQGMALSVFSVVNDARDALRAASALPSAQLGSGAPRRRAFEAAIALLKEAMATHPVEDLRAGRIPPRDGERLGSITEAAAGPAGDVWVSIRGVRPGQHGRGRLPAGIVGAIVEDRQWNGKPWQRFIGFRIDDLLREIEARDLAATVLAGPMAETAAEVEERIRSGLRDPRFLGVRAAGTDGPGRVKVEMPDGRRKVVVTRSGADWATSRPATLSARDEAAFAELDRLGKGSRDPDVRDRDRPGGHSREPDGLLESVLPELGRVATPQELRAAGDAIENLLQAERERLSKAYVGDIRRAYRKHNPGKRFDWNALRRAPGRLQAMVPGIQAIRDKWLPARDAHLAREAAVRERLATLVREREVAEAAPRGTEKEGAGAFSVTLFPPAQSLAVLGRMDPDALGAWIRDRLAEGSAAPRQLAALVAEAAMREHSGVAAAEHALAAIDAAMTGGWPPADVEALRRLDWELEGLSGPDDEVVGRCFAEFERGVNATIADLDWGFNDWAHGNLEANIVIQDAVDRLAKLSGQELATAFASEIGRIDEVAGDDAVGARVAAHLGVDLAGLMRALGETGLLAPRPDNDQTPLFALGGHHQLRLESALDALGQDLAAAGAAVNRLSPWQAEILVAGEARRLGVVDLRAATWDERHLEAALHIGEGPGTAGFDLPYMTAAPPPTTMPAASLLGRVADAVAQWRYRLTPSNDLAPMTGAPVYSVTSDLRGEGTIEGRKVVIERLNSEVEAGRPGIWQVTVDGFQPMIAGSPERALAFADWRATAPQAWRTEFELDGLAPPASMPFGLLPPAAPGDLLRFPGWNFGESWNGFAVPYFERRQLEDFMAAHKAAGEGPTLRFDADGRTLRISVRGAAEETAIPPITVETLAGPREVWRLGAGWWFYDVNLEQTYTRIKEHMDERMAASDPDAVRARLEAMGIDMDRWDADRRRADQVRTLAADPVRAARMREFRSDRTKGPGGTRHSIGRPDGVHVDELRATLHADELRARHTDELRAPNTEGLRAPPADGLRASPAGFSKGVFMDNPNTAYAAGKQDRRIAEILEDAAAHPAAAPAPGSGPEPVAMAAAAGVGIGLAVGEEGLIRAAETIGGATGGVIDTIAQAAEAADAAMPDGLSGAFAESVVESGAAASGVIANAIGRVADHAFDIADTAVRVAGAAAGISYSVGPGVRETAKDSDRAPTAAGEPERPTAARRGVPDPQERAAIAIERNTAPWREAFDGLRAAMREGGVFATHGLPESGPWTLRIARDHTFDTYLGEAALSRCEDGRFTADVKAYASPAGRSERPELVDVPADARGPLRRALDVSAIFGALSQPRDTEKDFSLGGGEPARASDAISPPPEPSEPEPPGPWGKVLFVGSALAAGTALAEALSHVPWPLTEPRFAAGREGSDWKEVEGVHRLGMPGGAFIEAGPLAFGMGVYADFEGPRGQRIRLADSQSEPALKTLEDARHFGASLRDAALVQMEQARRPGVEAAAASAADNEKAVEVGERSSPSGLRPSADADRPAGVVGSSGGGEHISPSIDGVDRSAVKPFAVDPARKGEARKTLRELPVDQLAPLHRSTMEALNGASRPVERLELQTGLAAVKAEMNRRGVSNDVADHPGRDGVRAGTRRSGGMER